MQNHRLFGLVLVLLSSCIHEQGLSYDQLTIEAQRADGSTIARYPKCFTMPILHGSIVDERHTIDGSAVILVHATDSMIDVGFEGVTDPSALARSITLDDLKAGYVETLSIQSTGGEAFMVLLSRGCR